MPQRLQYSLPRCVSNTSNPVTYLKDEKNSQPFFFFFKLLNPKNRIFNDKDPTRASVPVCRRSFCSTKQRASLLLTKIAPNFPKQVFKYSAKSRGYLPRDGNNKNLRAAAGHQHVSSHFPSAEKSFQQQRKEKIGRAHV